MNPPPSAPPQSASLELRQWAAEPRGLETPEAVGKGLALAGAVLRRRAVAGEEDAALAERLLRTLPRAAVEQWAAGLSASHVAAALRRAADEALEAGLPELGEDAQTWAQWAAEGLWVRDRLQSALRALRFLTDEGQAWAQGPLAAAKETAGQVDRDATVRARWLTPLNPARRRERALLDPEEQASAWWFCARAECDGLLEWLGGEAPVSTHVAGCAACRDDLAHSASVATPRERHLSAEELWRHDTGEADAAERAVIVAHTARCPECRQALAALAEGERAIAELETAPQAVSALGAPSTAARGEARARRGERGLRVDRRDLRVFVERRGRRTSVRLVPLAGRVLTRVSARLGTSGILQATGDGDEVTFELGEGEPEGRLELGLQWDDGNEALVIEL